MQISVTGSIVAMVTPLRDDTIEDDKVRELVDWHVRSGTAGIVVCGTTGEAPTLTAEEQDRVIGLAVEAADGRIPVIAGTGSYSTAVTIARTRAAERAGAAAALVVCPYYNRPTQQGLYEHFRAIAEAVSLPLVLYNLPSRTAVNLEPAVLAKLAQDCRNIIAVKEGSASLDQMSEIVSLCRDRIALLSSDDSLALPCIAVGGRGVISTIANIVPGDVAEMVRSALSGDMAEARAGHRKLFPLAQAAFIETNPIPIKEAMAMLGIIAPELRLPMCRMGESNRARLRVVLEEYGLLDKRGAPAIARRAAR
jgi:4-hydroxy-tetrahydrodipicolinate synthase